MGINPPVQMVAKSAGAGKYKSELEWWNMLVRGFMSGAYIAMGAGLATVCSTGVEAALGVGIGKLILGSVFPVGLIITIITGAELFTGDAMLAPLAAFFNKTTWTKVLILWVIVYIGNLIGSIVYAYIMANGPFVSFNAAGVATVNAMGLTAVNIGLGKVSYVGMAGMWSAFLKAIGCNWLVNLAVLLGICADDVIGKMVGIWFPIMAFVSSGFEHCVANMYFIPAGILTSGYLNPEQIATIGAEKLATLNWVSMWTNNIIIVTLGNIVGGMIFVGLIYYIAFKKEVEALE